MNEVSQVGEISKLSGRFNMAAGRLSKSCHVVQTQANGITLNRAFALTEINIYSPYLDVMPPCVIDGHGWRPESHRLVVE